MPEHGVRFPTATEIRAVAAIEPSLNTEAEAEAEAGQESGDAFEDVQDVLAMQEERVVRKSVGRKRMRDATGSGLGPGVASAVNGAERTNANANVNANGGGRVLRPRVGLKRSKQVCVPLFIPKFVDR